MLKSTIRTLALVAFLTSPAFAEYGDQGSIEVGPYAGYGFPDSYNGLNLKNNLIYGARIGFFMTPTVSFEPSYQMMFTDTKLAPAADHGAQLRSLRFNLLYNFLPETRIRPFVTAGLGWEHTKVNTLVNGDDLGVNGGAGLRIFLTEQIAARLEGRINYIEISKLGDARQYNYEGLLGFTYFFGGKPPKDTDSDGVPDKKDTCPETPKGATVDAEGCPSDDDGDKVFNGIDKCAGTPKIVKVDSVGCPLDTDGDAVPDGVDQCEQTPKGMPVDAQGCAIDKDGDGIVDPQDQCPDTPKATPVDAKGCPLDTDGDTVPDHLDQCPDTPKGSQIDEKGCPVVSKARGVLKGVNFKFASAELLPESLKVLDDVAKELNEFPKVRVEVQGHTDNVGAKDVNLKMSQLRAEAVMKFLAAKGVDASRMEAKGYGDSQPIAPNKTKDGKRKNRRVELKWLD